MSRQVRLDFEPSAARFHAQAIAGFVVCLVGFCACTESEPSTSESDSIDLSVTDVIEESVWELDEFDDLPDVESDASLVDAYDVVADTPGPDVDVTEEPEIDPGPWRSLLYPDKRSTTPGNPSFGAR